jgi:hypothetical protein
MRRFQLVERPQDERNLPPPSPPERPDYKVQWIPLFIWREDAGGKGKTRRIHDFNEVAAGDRMLFMVPLDQFRGKTVAVE